MGTGVVLHLLKFRFPQFYYNKQMSTNATFFGKVNKSPRNMGNLSPSPKKSPVPGLIPNTQHSTSGVFKRKIAQQTEEASEGSGFLLLKGFMKKKSPQKRPESAYNKDLNVNRSVGKLQRTKDNMNSETRYNEHRQMLNRIKANQQEIKQKTEGFLTRKNSHNQSAKCLKSTASQTCPWLLGVTVAAKNPEKAMMKTQSSMGSFIKDSQKETEIIRISHGESIESFEIIQFIDEGCYGKVFLVRHILTNFLYCLKKMAKASFTEETKYLLIREIKIQSYLDHPHIVNLYQFFSDETYIYLLLEPCLDGNLFKKMQKANKNCIPEKEVKKYLKEVSSGIEYLHKNDVLHRDLKPENILLHQNTAKICDFGWAIHSPLLRNTQCGTPLYTPPEVIKNEFYDNKIDVWCLGVLTYELLYGQPPFQVRKLRDVSKIISDDIKYPNDRGVSSVAIEFMKGCMEKTPALRLQIRHVREHDFIVNNRINQKYRSTIM